MRGVMRGRRVTAEDERRLRILVDAICTVCGITEEGFYSRTRVPPHPDCRMMFVHVGVCRMGIHGKDLSRILGKDRTYSIHVLDTFPVYYAVDRVFESRYDRVVSAFGQRMHRYLEKKLLTEST